MKQKKCGRCKKTKSFDDFNKCKNGTFGLHGHCRGCQKEVKKEWYKNNREKELAAAKDNYPQTRERYKVRYHNDPEFRERELKKNRVRRRREDVKEKQRAYERRRYTEDIDYKIAKNLRSRFNKVIKRKNNSVLSLTGCSINELKNYLAGMFLDGMSWDNYGEWHIDHIRPCVSFDLSDPQQQKECFHFTNLQPLWAFDNQSKGSKVAE